MAERRRDKLQAFGLRHLRYVIAAADIGSFRRAAAAIGVQESAISRRIRDLEDKIGAALFIRSNSGVRLTQAGLRRIASRVRARHVPVRDKVAKLVGTDDLLTLGMQLMADAATASTERLGPSTFGMVCSSPSSPSALSG